MDFEEEAEVTIPRMPHKNRKIPGPAQVFRRNFVVCRCAWFGFVGPGDRRWQVADVFLLTGFDSPAQ